MASAFSTVFATPPMLPAITSAIPFTIASMRWKILAALVKIHLSTR